MRFSRACRTHLEEINLAATGRGLQRGLRSCQASTDDTNTLHHFRLTDDTPARTFSGSSRKPHDAPFGKPDRADRFVEADGGLVPVQHIPFEPRAAFIASYLCKMNQECLT